eukprot:6210899-Pleurochrysis_carterae.AAC.1
MPYSILCMNCSSVRRARSWVDMGVRASARCAVALSRCRASLNILAATQGKNRMGAMKCNESLVIVPN